VAWGRFYEKLPWPKRDRAKAERALRGVLAGKNPNNLRARVFLADTLAHDGRAPEAKRLLDEVAAAPLGRYDAAEERRAKALGDGLMPTVTKLMK
jgi:cytochrome c-type biogenesis protein CcmH/NrfG